MTQVFDLDGTLITTNCSMAFLRFLRRKGEFSIFAIAYSLLLYLIYRIRLCSLGTLHRLAFNCLFRGKHVDTLEAWVPSFLDECLEAILYPPVVKRLKASQARGEPVAIYSSSPRYLVAAIAERLNVEDIVATDYILDDQGCMRGIATLVDGQHKADALGEGEHVAYSDSIDDLPLLLAVKHPVAVRPDFKLKAYAHKRGWETL